MSVKTFSRIGVVLVFSGTLAVVAGGGCFTTDNGQQNVTPAGAGADSVTLAFSNLTPFVVDVVVDGEVIGSLDPNGTATTFTDNCAAAVDSISIQGTANNITSAHSLTFLKGNDFNCGDTIHITYFINANGSLDLEGLTGS
jgi:hypothetical protein